MVSSKGFLLLGLFLAVVLLICSEVAAKEHLSKTSITSEQIKDKKAQSNNVEDAKYGGYPGRGYGGYPGGGYGGYTGGRYGGYPGGGYGGYPGGGYGGYPGGGYGGRGGYCRYGCCYRGYYGCRRCCNYAGETVEKHVADKPHN